MSGKKSGIFWMIPGQNPEQKFDLRTVFDLR
jgi:hypothetical protein